MEEKLRDRLDEYDVGVSYDISDFIEDTASRIHKEFERYEEFHPAILGEESGQKLYDLIREASPDIMVETGVCNGFSSSVILKAMQDNGKGHLYSVDLPVNLDDITPEVKTGAVLPPGKESGWAVPYELRERWDLKIGNTYHELPNIFESLSSDIDIFLHDSDHSYETMMFEFALAWRNLKEDRFLLADNIDFSQAFFDFTEAKDLNRYRLGDMGMMIKVAEDTDG